MKFTSYTVQTNFGCSGIAEFGPTSESLISEIDLPDQAVNTSDRYMFTYEATPGHSGNVTGRLASVTLPTGGTINYTYTGGSNGIECTDGSAAGLTRQTPDGTWTYARTLGTAPATTTTITDPQSNQTVEEFQGIYPTEAQTYQGSASSGTLLKTTYTCYNGASSPCNSTAITLPITQRTHILQWPGSSGLESQTVTSYNSYGLVTEKDEYAYGVGAPGSVVRKTLTTYASLTNGIVNRPASVTVEDGSSNIKRRPPIATTKARLLGPRLASRRVADCDFRYAAARLHHRLPRQLDHDDGLCQALRLWRDVDVLRHGQYHRRDRR